MGKAHIVLDKRDIMIALKVKILVSEDEKHIQIIRFPVRYLKIRDPDTTFRWAL